MSPGDLDQPLAVALPLPVRCLGGQQALAEAAGSLAIGRAEVAVAAAQRQAVRLAHGRHRDDLDRQIQVAHHLPDHGTLLEVLLAEEGHIRLHDVEQLGDHGGDPAEVPGPDGAAQRLGHGAGLDSGLEAGRIDLARHRAAKIMLTPALRQSS